MSDFRTFDDLTVGETESFGEYTVSESEIVEFAERYDPQPIHMDPEAAKETQFGGLIASGWQTAAVGQRLFVQNVLNDLRAEGSPGVEDLEFLNPLRPGTTVSGQASIASKRRLESRSDFGLVTFDESIWSTEGVDLVSMHVHVFVSRD